MQTNIKKYTLPVLLMAIVVLLLVSCKKETPAKFSGENFLYFRNGNVTNPDVTNIQGVYRSEKTFSFLNSLYQMDTMRFNEVYDFTLWIQADGKISGTNRTVRIQLEGNGLEYAVLPHPDSIYIKANEIQYQLNLKLARPPLSDTGTKTLTLTLKNNEGFTPENHTWNKITYKFGNILEAPRYYDMQETFYGQFSSAKIATMHEAIARKGAAYWQTNANIISLNDFISLRGGKQLNFDPFTLNDLYNFIDVQELLFGITTGPLRDAFNNINAEVISLSKALLVEKKEAGNPVKDQSGKEISFP